MFLRSAALAALFVVPVYAQAPAPAPAQSDTAPAALPDGRELIDRHVKAIGGRPAFLAKKSMHVIGTLNVPASGITGPVEVFAAANPDRVLVKTNVPGIGEVLEGFDGSHGWIMMSMTGPMLKADKQLQQAKLDADFYADLRDPKKYPGVKTVEKTTFDGRPCYKVALRRIDGSDDVDFYDAATGLRAGGIITRETPMGSVTTTTTLADYKKFGNMLIATMQRQKVMGVEHTVTIGSVVFDKVDPAVFTPPAEIKALIK
jgi:hypothetical protein